MESTIPEPKDRVLEFGACFLELKSINLEPMKDNALTVQQIVARCGGAPSISARSDVSSWAVYKWYRNGIPNEHWDLLMEMSGVTAAEIHQANRMARAREMMATA